MDESVIMNSATYREAAKDLEDLGMILVDEPSTKERIEQMLDELAEAEAERGVVASEWAVEIAKLQAYQDGACEEIDAQIAVLKADIKAATVAYGKSVKGARLQASFTKPRIKWDDKALVGYAAAGHAELFAFRTEGKPSCSIRVRRS